jgi:hypothetical protein
MDGFDLRVVCLARYPLRTMSTRKLRDILFRSLDRDEQLLLAVTLCKAESEEAAPRGEVVVGVTTWRLYEWLRAAQTDRRRGHPNIDAEWTTDGELRAALVRLKKRGLVRNSVPYQYQGAPTSLWRATNEGGAFLRERLLFRDAAA